MVVDDVISILIKVFRLIKIVLTLVKHDIQKLLFISLLSFSLLFWFVLIRLKEQNVVWPILFNDMTANYLSASAVNGGIRFAIGLSWIVQNPISIMEIEQSVALFFFPKPCFNTELCLYLLAILVLLLTIHLALNRVEVLLLVICINSLNERLALSQIDILKAGLLLRIARWLIFGNYRIVKTIVLLNSSRHIIRIKDRLKIVARFFHSN